MVLTFLVLGLVPARLARNLFAWFSPLISRVEPSHRQLTPQIDRQQQLHLPRGAKAVNQQALSHIPFRVEDELMIRSMARWMKFIGIVKVVGSLFVLFVAFVALIYSGVEMVRTRRPWARWGDFLPRTR